VGPIQDACSAGVLIANAAIGIVQEIRAKRTLDRLTLLSAPARAWCAPARCARCPVDEGGAGRRPRPSSGRSGAGGRRGAVQLRARAGRIPPHRRVRHGAEGAGGRGPLGSFVASGAGRPGPLASGWMPTPAPSNGRRAGSRWCDPSSATGSTSS
jgi:hypothetical protein